jgi:hypothetical protein
MLLPMLAMACVYILTKIFRNRKISKALWKDFYSLFAFVLLVSW